MPRVVQVAGGARSAGLEVHAAIEHADPRIIELRLDLIDGFDLPMLLKEAGKPCIVTNRCKKDGGQFAGTEEERVEILRRAIELGADYIDIETSTPGPLLKSILENKGGVKVILSHHDFTRTPDDLIPLYDLMNQMPADSSR